MSVHKEVRNEGVDSICLFQAGVRPRDCVITVGFVGVVSDVEPSKKDSRDSTVTVLQAR